MTDYASTSQQFIAQGLITIVDGAPVFSGRGFSAIERTPGGAADGDFLLTFDDGLPGAVGVDPTVSRVILTLRGGSGSPPVTTITQKSATWVTSGTTGVGCKQLRVITSVGGTGTDPTGADAGGLELIVMKQATPSNYQVQISGPLYP